MDGHTTGTRLADIADIIELWVWPPMAGLHSAEAGLLAGSGGSGCATAWHRHALQPKAGAVPCCCRAGGLRAVVKERLYTKSPSPSLEASCGNRAMRAGGRRCYPA